MHTIAYVSTAKKLFSSDDLLELLTKSWESNTNFGVTGLLLYKAGNFMQAIEGPKVAINRLYKNICLDPRHHQIITLIDEPIEERNYNGWHMGFAHVNRDDFARIQGFSSIFQEPYNADSIVAKAGHVKQLLSSFGASKR